MQTLWEVKGKGHLEKEEFINLKKELLRAYKEDYEKTNYMSYENSEISNETKKVYKVSNVNNLLKVPVTLGTEIGYIKLHHRRSSFRINVNYDSTLINPNDSKVYLTLFNYLAKIKKDDKLNCAFICKISREMEFTISLYGDNPLKETTWYKTIAELGKLSTKILDYDWLDESIHESIKAYEESCKLLKNFVANKTNEIIKVNHWDKEITPLINSKFKWVNNNSSQLSKEDFTDLLRQEIKSFQRLIFKEEYDKIIDSIKKSNDIIKEIATKYNYLKIN